MRIKCTLFLLLSILALSTFAQGTYRYLGLHYGGHSNWEYFNEVRTDKNGDTLFYEQKRYDRFKIKNPDRPALHHKTSLLVKNDKVIILYDSLNQAQGWYTLEAFSDLEQAKVMSNRLLAPAVVNHDQLPFFSTLEALELYLRYTPLHANFEQYISLGLNKDSDGFRKFKIKVIGSLRMAAIGDELRDCFRVAIISLDGSNTGDSKFIIDKATGDILEKEYVVTEEHGQSIGYEKFIPWDYSIDLEAIPQVSALNLLEKALELLEKGHGKEEVMGYVNKAFEKEANISTIPSKIEVLNYYEDQDQLEEFITIIIEKERLNEYVLKWIGEYLLKAEMFDYPLRVFQGNVKKYPDSYVPLIGLAVYYNAIGEFQRAKTYLAQTLTFSNIEADEKDRIEQSIKNLSSNQPMLAIW